MDAKPTSFLRQALNLQPIQKRDATTQAIQQTNLVPTLKPVFRIMSQVEKTLDSQIQKALRPLTQARTTTPELKNALETLQALIPPNPEITLLPRTQASNLRALYAIRDTTIKQVLSRIRHQFTQITHAENQRIVQALYPFRAASRTLEIQIANYAGMAPGAPPEEKDSKTIQSPNQTPVAVTSTVATCAQISLTQRIKKHISDEPQQNSAEKKDLNPPITQQEYSEIQKALLTIENRRAELSPALKARIQFLTQSPVIERGTLLTLSSIFRSLNPEPLSLSALEREEALFAGNVQDVGTSIENLDGIHETETQARRNLTELFDAFALVTVPDSFIRPSSPETLRLSLFQSIRKVAPTLGKTTTIMMVDKLAEDHAWLPNYFEHGPDAILNADSYRNFVSISEPEETLFGGPSDQDQHLTETQDLRETLTLINQAEGLIYTKENYAAITHPHRETILELAKRLSDDDLPPQNITPEYTRDVFSHISNPEIDSLLQVTKRLFDENVPSEEQNRIQLLKNLATTRHNAASLHKAIAKEADGALRSLETLPDELRKLEENTKVASSLVRIVSLLSQRDVFSSIQREIENQSTLLTAQQEAETLDLAAQTNITERLATLQALRDLVQNPDEMDGETYQQMIKVITHQQPPETIKERALITLLDHKTNDGLRIRTTEILTKVEAEAPSPFLLSRIRSDLGVLRRFSEFLTVPSPQPPTRLALAICKTPLYLKSHCRQDLLSGLKNTLAAHPWKNPTSPKAEDITATYTHYLAAKQTYKDDPGGTDLLNSIQNLYKRTSEILTTNAGQLTQTNAIALDLVSEAPTSLKTLENRVLNAILDHPNPLPAIEFLAAWENTIGNQTTLIHQNISASDRPQRTSMPIVAARLQTKIENLLALSDHYKAIADEPTALAETYIQFERAERLKAEQAKQLATQPWTMRIDRSINKVELQITNLQTQIKDYEKQYLNLFEPKQETPKQDTETGRKEVSKLLGKQERRLRELVLKHQRLQEQKDLSLALNKANTPEEIKEAIHAEPKLLTSLADALDHALRITPDTERVALPSLENAQVIPIQMLEGAAIHQSLNRIQRLLKDAQKSLDHLTPALRDHKLETINPLVAVSELKKALFTHLKEFELQMSESAKNIDLSPVDMAEFIAENPELQTTQNQWIETLHNTYQRLEDTLTYVKQLPKQQIVQQTTPSNSKTHTHQPAELTM